VSAPEIRPLNGKVAGFLTNGTRMAALRPLLATLLALSCRIAYAQEPPPEATEEEAPPPELDLTPRLSGYLQVFFRLNVDSNGDGEHRPSAFRVQRARLEVDGDLTERISYQVEIDPRPPLVTGFLRDCYLAVRLLQHQTLRIGQQKTPWGWENRQSSTELFTVNRTELSDSLGRGVNLRDLGLGLVGRHRLGGGFRLEDHLAIVNGAGMNVQEDDDGRKNLWGRLGLRYKFGENKAWLGVSGGMGSMFEEGDLEPDPRRSLPPGVDVDDDDAFILFRRVGTDVEYDGRWAFAAAELAMGREETRPSSPGEPLAPPREVATSTGYYLMALVKTPWRLGPLARYDVLDEDWERLTLGAYYGNPEDRIRFLLNAELRREEGKASDVRSYLWMQGRF
jgi:hypothetical protein